MQFDQLSIAYARASGWDLSTITRIDYAVVSGVRYAVVTAGRIFVVVDLDGGHIDEDLFRTVVRQAGN